MMRLELISLMPLVGSPSYEAPQQPTMYARTCKIWISPVSDRTYLNILDMMKSPEVFVLSYAKNIGIRRAISFGKPEELDFIWLPQIKDILKNCLDLFH